MFKAGIREAKLGGEREREMFLRIESIFLNNGH